MSFIERLTALNAEAYAAFAQEISSNRTIEERLENLDQQIRILERKREIDEETSAAKSKETPVFGAGKDGFFLKSADGAYQLKFRGDFQADGRFFIGDKEKPVANTFLVRRARPVLEGTLAKYYTFKIQTDFGQGTTTLNDAYIDINYWSGAARIRVGKYKSPFGLERLQSSTDTFFAELGLPSNLTPNYDVGLQLHGDLLDGAVNYAIGVFNGVPDNSSADVDSNDGKDYIGRIFTQPFKKGDLSALEDLGIGFAVSSGDHDGTTSSPALPSYKTAGQQTFFSYTPATGTPYAYGKSFRISPQAYWYFNSVGLLCEYILSTQRVKKNGSSDKELTNDAWQIAASYVLTGEKPSYKGVVPKGPYGAWEIALRYSELSIDSNTFPVYANIATSARGAKARAAGLNWYLDKNVKAVLDYEETRFDGGRSTGNRETEKALFSRLQVVF